MSFTIINAIIVSLGIPTIIGACIYIGRKLQTLDTLQQSFDKLQDSFYEDHDNIILMKAKVLGVSNSPYRPNETGIKLLSECGWGVFYSTIKKDILDKIEQEKPKTLYDVERLAFRHLHNYKNEDLAIPFKTYIVNHPEHSLDSIFLVGSWIIRDDYQKDRNGMIV
ncbi:MAG: hypothetical protein A2261_00650 [Candidatus Magasanikbacteria bacterium RIFOXYA2_FULL_44_8]|uniref:Uncharacterized protein n=1 Tax=Candidatus Magasanikbacteria bacterium RIFOXYA2_FULL_44_8 TaxID=1798696 RepID=A0A1F6NKR8_9BACT|nr:MAG: hypothetical protein A2261_00650 [Candidatus Magasanikbacteria bacterium RIFOXYA2_FULL_44_8]